MWKKLLWTLIILVFLLFWTLVKLPDDRIRGHLLTFIESTLDSQGIELRTESSELRLFPTIRFKLVHGILRKEGTAVGSFDTFSIQPHLLHSLFSSSIHASYAVEIGKGKASGTLSFPRSFQKKSSASFSLDAVHFNIGATGLPSVLGVSAQATLDGTLALEMNVWNDPSTLIGKSALRITGLITEPQSIAGFSVPKLEVDSGEIIFQAQKGTMTLTNVHLSKLDSFKDLFLKIQGDIHLGQNLSLSTLNLHTVCALSETAKKSFPLIDTLLSAGKKPDDSYAFAINGTFEQPIPTPEGT